ncbi:hypothetical protein [Furfurilactobacillus rossiae]|uniref:Uncharacterized protein n=1 Tax=Furfurilactobacillus rossiae DSM 15814 TaxID=1114972 RepID=A0A0R1RRY0_9LACO|nr:hypothetical protein [Furfurilactobacillus rossiae]KRL56629.1 hypothetical protein FD35_GL001724 [Furfurilactobacillus rossiae DSM 15814]QFR66470.1 hypothetical protein LR814_04900 [Furfurilactobacillus rossiae]QLE61931.1 hypothetical protein LROSRS0_1886 [Furfurilactobacillus rossiae]
MISYNISSIDSIDVPGETSSTLRKEKDVISAFSSLTLPVKITIYESNQTGYTITTDAKGTEVSTALFDFGYGGYGPHLLQKAIKKIPNLNDTEKDLEFIDHAHGDEDGNNLNGKTANGSEFAYKVAITIS